MRLNSPIIRCFKSAFERSIVIRASSMMLEEYRSNAISLCKWERIEKFQQFAWQFLSRRSTIDKMKLIV